MTDTYARMRTIYGTSQQWIDNDIVIGAGEIAAENAGTEVKIKVGDGTKTFSALPYISGAAAGGGVTPAVTAAIQAAVALMLPKAGGAMTGPLTLMTPLVPQPAHAISRSWVEQNIKQIMTAGTVFATGAEVIAGIAPDKAVTPATLSSAGITASTGIADTNKLVKTDAGGKIDHSFIDETVTGGTTAQAGKLVALDANGSIDVSLLGAVAGGMTFKGTIDLTGAAPASPADGDFYFAQANAVVGAGFTGIVGQNAARGDSVVFGNGAWHLLLVDIDTNAFLPLDGSKAMTDGAAITFDNTTTPGGVIINGDGGVIDNAILDAGTY